VREGERVMDAGCGFRDTARLLAGRVAPEGEVVGIDCCEAFLGDGRREAAGKGLANVRFVEADIERHPFAGDFDIAFSRFGKMFFTGAVAALRNIRGALKPGGRSRRSSGARARTTRGARWRRRCCCATCPGPARTPTPAGRGRSRWPTATPSPGG
jgi:ubiquinone/menaquinone biosynthesis C-methylase UbiE